MSGKRILLAHGAGGRAMGELIDGVFRPILGDGLPEELTDAAVLPPLPGERVAVTTDGFVVDPPEFPGGDLGALSVYGTVNDLAMVGARPRWLTWSLILEEGTELALVERITRGAADAARRAGVSIVAGDTKVVPRGKGDGVFATTAGVGTVPKGRVLGDRHIRPGDRVLCSGPLGDHGAAVLATRHGIEGPVSDCAPLHDLVETLLESGAEVRALHDPTRGGVVAVGHEVAARAGVALALEEAALPIHEAVRTLCELLGLEPLALACEGRLLAWVTAETAEAALAALQGHPQGEGARLIGEVTRATHGGSPLVLRTRYGQARPLDLRVGEDLPRIC